MNAHYLTTSRSNPQFYIFSQLFERAENSENFVDLKPEWQDQTQQVAWVGFWDREGYDLLEQKWYKLHPQYTQLLHHATREELQSWEEQWQQHSTDLSAQFWHIFSCAFNNYERDLSYGLQCVGSSLTEADEHLDKVDEHLAGLDIDQNIDSSETSESDIEDDPELLEEQDQLRRLGLPTSFGTQVAGNQRKFKSRPAASESESDNDIEMPKENYAALHAVHSGGIKKKRQNRMSKRVPDFIQGDNNMLKYWFKRFSLFSLFDQGIQLDRESWFSVTPEKIAKQTACRLACDIIVDGFCGCGGNAIQFAKTCGRVIAIDIDVDKLAKAKHNAAIYGVAHKIEFINADFMEFARCSRLRPDVVFLSPPWGGPGYQKQATFDIEQSLLPVGATQLMQLARCLTENIGFYLPRNSNVQQVIALTHAGQQCEVEHNYLDTRLVAITAYYGSRLVANQTHCDSGDRKKQEFRELKDKDMVNTEK